MIRVLNVAGYLACGGIESVVANYASVIDRDRYAYDFIAMDISLQDTIEKLRSTGSKVFLVCSRRENIIKHTAQTYKILKRFRTEYDILHCHSNQDSFITLFLGKLLGYRIRIAHSHTSYLQNRLGPYIRLGRCLTAAFATHGAGCSAAASEFLFVHRKMPVKIIKNPIAYHKYRFNNELRYQLRKDLQIGGRRAFVLVGRLAEEKNHLWLCSLMKEKDMRESILFFIGDGSKKDDIKAYIVENKLEERVILLGNRDDVPELLNAFDGFLLPSIHEGFPLVLLEAQVNGLFCVASDRVPGDVDVSDRIRHIALERDLWLQEMRMITIRDASADFKIDSSYNLEKAVVDLENYYKELSIG